MTTPSAPAAAELILLYRVEPGCLGPDGLNHVEAFCRFSNAQRRPSDWPALRWHFTPRYDKSLPEIEFRWHEKPLRTAQVEQILSRLQTNLERVEAEMGEKTAELIELFLRPSGRAPDA